MAVVLPGEGIAVASVIREAVGALAVPREQGEIIAASADDDAVVGAEVVIKLGLAFCGEGYIVLGVVEVAGGLQMADALVIDIGLHLAEVAVVAQDACEMTGQGMERGVEDELTAVLTADAVVGVAGHQHQTEHAEYVPESVHLPKSLRSASVIRSKWKPSSVCCMRA